MTVSADSSPSRQYIIFCIILIYIIYPAELKKLKHIIFQSGGHMMLTRLDIAGAAKRTYYTLAPHRINQSSLCFEIALVPGLCFLDPCRN